MDWSSTIGSLEPSTVVHHREHSSTTAQSNALRYKLLYKVFEKDLLDMSFCQDPNMIDLEEVDNCDHKEVDGAYADDDRHDGNSPPLP
jgi:hypothetical protein